MRVDGGLLGTLARELVTRAWPPWRPGQALARKAPGLVDADSEAWWPGGVLSGAYVYHLAQMCEVFRPDDTVLDLGCGAAHLLGRLAALNPTVHFVGVEPSRRLAREGEERIAAQGLRNLEIDLADMSYLDHWARGSVQAVISSLALHHLSDTEALERLFRNVRRVLVPGGGVYLWDFGRLRRRESIDYFVRRAIGRAGPGIEPWLARDYERSLRAAFSREEVCAAARRHLDQDVRVYSTALSPLVLVVKSAPRRCAHPLRPKLLEWLHGLPDAHQRDVRRLQLFLRLGGLRGALL
jgi:arsenite methyltransferase